MLLYFNRNKIVGGFSYGTGVAFVPDALAPDALRDDDARPASPEETAAYLAGRESNKGYAGAMRAGEIETSGTEETVSLTFSKPMPGGYVVFLFWKNHFCPELVFDKRAEGFRVQLQGRVVGAATIRYYVCPA